MLWRAAHRRQITNGPEFQCPFVLGLFDGVFRAGKPVRQVSGNAAAALNIVDPLISQERDAQEQLIGDGDEAGEGETLRRSRLVSRQPEVILQEIRNMISIGHGRRAADGRVQQLRSREVTTAPQVEAGHGIGHVQLIPDRGGVGSDGQRG